MTTNAIDNITLINGDCMEYLRSLPDNAFDLAVVDPPYGIGVNKMKLGNGKNKPFQGQNNWDKLPPPIEYFIELKRVSKDQIIWGGNYFTCALPPCDNWIIWDKCNPNLSFAEGEMAWCSIHRKLRIFKYYSVNIDGGKTHPCQKPIALYAWILNNYAKPGDRILDTHLGSGSSAIAAWELGYEFVGIEIDSEYYNNAVERIKRHTAQGKLF